MIDYMIDMVAAASGLGVPDGFGDVVDDVGGIGPPSGGRPLHKLQRLNEVRLKKALRQSPAGLSLVGSLVMQRPIRNGDIIWSFAAARTLALDNM